MSDDIEVFRTELDGNPRVWETDDGYRLTFRYSTVNTGALTAIVKVALWIGLPILGYFASTYLTAWSPQTVGLSFWLPILGLLGAFYFAHRVDMPLYTGRLTMVFTDKDISWRSSSARKGTVPCTPNQVPVAQVREDRIGAKQEERRRKKGRKGPIVMTDVQQVVFTSSQFAVNWQKLVSIYADDARIQALRLTAAINLLIEATGRRTLERHYGT